MSEHFAVLNLAGKKLGSTFRTHAGTWHALYAGGNSLRPRCDFPTRAGAEAAIRGEKENAPSQPSKQMPPAAQRPANVPASPPAITTQPQRATPMTISDTEFLNDAAQGARNEWAASAGLRGEFKTAEDYASFKFAAGSGNVAAVGDGWQRQWRASTELQAEFPSAETYEAFKRHEARKRSGRH
jgi:hypothetical protein